jgi:uncharacterized membrane protein
MNMGIIVMYAVATLISFLAGYKKGRIPSVAKLFFTILIASLFFKILTGELNPLVWGTLWLPLLFIAKRSIRDMKIKEKKQIRQTKAGH